LYCAGLCGEFVLFVASSPLRRCLSYRLVGCDDYKVKDEGRVVSRAVYNILAINKEGKKNLIGMYISESEGAKFWLSVLTDLKSRGVKDILIACTDNLNGFSEAILSVFPDTEIQKCIIHSVLLRLLQNNVPLLHIVVLKPVFTFMTEQE
jgi:transposase-like protein